MKINEWEIWHTYSTYIQVSFIDLDLAARRLVEAGIFELAMLRDGQTYWKGKSGIGSGTADIRMNSSGLTALVSFNEDEQLGCEPSDFALEAWKQAAQFRFNEIKVFGEDSALPHPYLRGFIGQFNFVFQTENHSEIRCYPILTLYETGIVLLELRTISPENPVDIKEFISDSVNLFRHSFKFAEVPPGVSKYATKAYYHTQRKWNFFKRVALLYMEREHDKAIDELTVRHEDGHFTFDLAPLSNSAGDDGNHEQLKSLSLSLFHTVAFIIIKPRSGLSFLLFGQRSTYRVAGYWTGRPHIHITKFEGQQKTSKENEKAYGEIWGSILARTFISNRDHAIRYLSKDQRHFQDYSVYINSTVSLWIWSLTGLSQQQEFSDANRGHLIYEHQAIVELLEYGNMLHYSLFNSIDEYYDSGEVLSARSSLVILDHGMNTASHFGEIREMLLYGWKEMGLDSLKDRIKSALVIREAETRLKETRITEKIGLVLTIIFGFGSIPSLSSEVLLPLWKLFDLPHMADEAAFQTMLNSLSLSLVAFALACILKWVGR